MLVIIHVLKQLPIAYFAFLASHILAGSEKLVACHAVAFNEVLLFFPSFLANYYDKQRDCK
jgi:hypothetical protein